MDTIRRRGIFKLCAAATAAIGARPELLAAAGGEPRWYERVALVDDRDRRLTENELRVGESYVFHYPYVTTPCFLIDLGRPVEGARVRTEKGAAYHAPSGVGSGRSIVAFAAICAHKMTHPSRDVSFINYRHEDVRFRVDDEEVVERSRVIFCCSERSVYDPAQGATVLAGPAKQPLAAILLEEDAEGVLHALGTLGGELYRDFFDSFGFRVALEHGTSDIQRRSAGTTTVWPIREYSANLRLCGA